MAMFPHSIEITEPQWRNICIRECDIDAPTIPKSIPKMQEMFGCTPRRHTRVTFDKVITTFHQESVLLDFDDERAKLMFLLRYSYAMD